MPSDRIKSDQFSRWQPAILLGITLLSYLSVFRAGFIWDDDRHVMHTPEQVSIKGLRQIWLMPGFMPQYYPMIHTLFWIEFHLWGVEPLGYHFGERISACAERDIHLADP